MTDDTKQHSSTAADRAAVPSEPGMAEIIERVMAHLHHLLLREESVGSSTPHLQRPVDEQGKEFRSERISEEELIGRLGRLIDHLEHVAEAFSQPSQRLAECLAPENPDVAMSLTPEELTSLCSDKAEISVPCMEIADLAAQVSGLETDVRSALSELKRVCSAHFGVAVRRGRPPTRRGKEIGAMLLGYAEGCGLAATATKSTRNQLGAGSAVEAVTEAIRRTEIPEDPAARAVFKQLPRGYEPIAKLKQSLGRDKNLRRLHEVNKAVAARVKNSGEKSIN